MTVKYIATVIISASTQDEVFETFGALVDACIDLANSQLTATVEVEELDPALLAYSEE